MPTKPIDRLLFAQGGLCFFCRMPLAKGEASVEHLVATSNGGPNTDDNCVACCVTLNAMFGRMSLKEKLQVVLNQQGTFRCPNGNKPAKGGKAAPPATTGAPLASGTDEAFERVVTFLEQQGDARPTTMDALATTISSLFPEGTTHGEVAALLRRLRDGGKIHLAGAEVTYTL